MPRLSDRALSNTFLRKLRPMDKRIDIYDAVRRGLGIRISPKGTKTWFAMRRVNGRMKRVSFGRYPEMGLSEARLKATDLLSEMDRGIIPVQSKADVFSDVMDEWLQRDQAGNRSVDEVKRALTQSETMRPTS